MSEAVDPEVAGLLDGLAGDARAQRAELIPWLVEQGITLEEIRASFAPMLLPGRRIFGDDGTRLSARQISERTGLDLDQLRRFQRASGLATVDDPDAAVFSKPDAESAVHIKRFLDLGFDPDRLLTVVRVLAEGLSHAAEAMRYTAVATTMQHPGTTELEMARGARELVAAAAPLLGPMVQDMLMLQLRHAMETEAVNANERAAGAPLPGARQVAVAFADLVGFTRLGELVPPEELERLANRLADAARDVAVRPVRFVKTIGDAVMLVSTDAVALLDAMLTLVEATEADEALPQLRAGMSYGLAVSRAGDWFGSPVNLASRVTSVSRPGSVLVSEAAREKIGDEGSFSWSFARARHLKGIQDDVKLFRARRAHHP
ncbi:adenylate/guanylate cyclase domain-containing protein [Mycobacterium sp. CVI_P3]|uniref:Adenylate/guanylate cyclase domain-containing protein n=1 Tax=Mycobacterium pinniadriaticum TaxID=2994102 RepID=A0ABT3SD08_9MYCO|nr:adenylate/guanylate cyclase domain-containing protein [Mycobacterium pinniadriaticum]MCX2930833.1 adenylate/guanylate cyclase domain-containing protein [Mycobacterium pinniadriaticum]MCX2937257.1 adenylate/guanylate cyclase domain-containing protein [Mycobacterium pinniadriaticum]